MKYSFFGLGFAALVSSQAIDFAAVDAAPEPTVVTVSSGAAPTVVAFNEEAAASSASVSATATATTLVARSRATAGALVAKRSACSVQPAGYGPVPSPDTAEAFLSDADFSSAANNAQTPSGYILAFQNQKGSTSTNAYMGYTTLTSYSPAQCAAKCSGINGCSAFNIYFERDPSVEPAAACPNPTSTNVIKCVFWGSPIYATNALNNGQWRQDFHVVIAGSNGYTKASHVDSLSGYAGTNLGQSAINAPTECDSYMGVQVFSDGTPFSPALCEAACEAKSAYSRLHDAVPKTCQYFNTYMLIKNGGSGVQVCSMYSSSWDASYAANNGQWRGSDHYTIDWSVSYSNTTDPGCDSCSD